MKNKKRKYLSCLFISLFICSIIHINTVYAASLSASADAASIKEGGQVNVSINLSGNPSISTLGAALGYDSSVLSFEGVSWSGSFSGSDMQMASDTGSEVNLSVVCEDSYSEDGTVATVKFRGVSDASSIPVTLSLRDMADADLEAVTDCKVSGKVRVPEGAGNTDEKPDTADKSKPVETDKPKKEVDSSGSGKQPEKGTDGFADTAASSNSTANTASTSPVGASSTVTVNAQKTADSGSQSTSVQKAQAGAVSDAGSQKPDQSYKTGAGIGNDIFLIIAVACGILALLLAVKRGEGRK